MKARFLLPYSILLSTLLFLGCSDHKQDDPTPLTTSHEVTILLRGISVLQELGAEIRVRSDIYKGGSMRGGPGFGTEITSNEYEGVAEAYKLGTFTNRDVIEVEIAFQNTNEGLGAPYPTFVPMRTNTKLTAYILVDGQERKSVTLDASQSGPGVEKLPYLKGFVSLDLSTL